MESDICWSNLNILINTGVVCNYENIEIIKIFELVEPRNQKHIYTYESVISKTNS